MWALVVTCGDAAFVDAFSEIVGLRAVSKLFDTQAKVDRTAFCIDNHGDFAFEATGVTSHAIIVGIPFFTIVPLLVNKNINAEIINPGPATRFAGQQWCNTALPGSGVQSGDVSSKVSNSETFEFLIHSNNCLFISARPNYHVLVLIFLSRLTDARNEWSPKFLPSAGL